MKALFAALLAAALAGCADTTWTRTEDQASTVRSRVRELLAKPLGPTEAVQIALLNNPGLQASSADGPRLALHTRKAWFEAVAALETARYMEQVKESAEASAELARRMAEIGNFPKLTQAREHTFYAEATAQLARARHNVTAARERLARLMGLRGEDLAFQLPARLPELPKVVRDAGELEAKAPAQPLARSEVREAYSAYRTAFDIARHYRDEIVPLRKRISEEVLLRYNGMLMSVFELLADSRDQVAAVNAYIEAVRDFWFADADLQMALIGGH